MNQNAIVAGSFADIRTVKSRSVVILCIEVPIERAGEVIDKFGFPQPGAEIPVAIARLVADPSPVATQGAIEPQRAPAYEAAERSKWDAMRPSAQVSTLCGDAYFKAFLGLLPATATDVVVDEVKHRLGIASRKELDADIEGPAATAWREMCAKYWRWRAGQREAEAQAAAYLGGR